MQPNGFPKPKSEKKIEYLLFVWGFFLIFSAVFCFYFGEIIYFFLISDIILTGYILTIIDNN